MIFKQLPTIINDLNKLGISLKSLDSINLGIVGVNTGNIQAYQTAIKGLSAEQAVFALATKGANVAQIEEIMATETATLAKNAYKEADIQVALIKNGLATASSMLTAAQQKEIVQSELLTAEKLTEIAATLGLETAENGSLISKKALNAEMVKQQLESIGVVGAAQSQILVMLGLTTAEGSAVTGTNLLTASFAKLWAIISVHPIGAILTAVGALAVGIVTTTKISKRAQEEARKTAIELTNAYNQEKSSLDSQIEKYKELKETLDNGNLSIDETCSIKEQLLEIQKSLIESYGNEASNIDLANGKYKEQLGLLSELSKEKATNYVTENRDVFANAKEALEKVREYNLGEIMRWNGRPEAISAENKALYDYIQNYSDLLELKDGFMSSRGYTSSYVTLKLNADVANADDLLHQFYVDIDQYGKDNNIDVSGLLEGISGQLKKTWTDELTEYKTIYDEFMKAEVVRNDTLRPLYQQSIQAVKDYNEALSTGEGVEEAKANLDSVQKSVQNATSELEDSQDVFDSIYESVNKNAESAYNLSQAFANSETVKGYAEQLQGLTEFDLQGINFEDTVQSPGEEAFGALIDILGLSKEEVQNLIDKLVELGYVQGEIQSLTSNDVSPTPSLTPSDTINQLNTQLKPAMDSLKSAWQDIFTDDGFALDSIDIISTCDSIKSKLDELNEIEGITVDYSAYEHFIDVLNNSDSTVDNVKESFNNLASSITQAGLSGAEDFETMKAALEDLGVVNEDLVAFDALISNTEALKEAGLDLASATEEQIAKFADEMVSADNLTQAIDMLTFTKLASNAANMDTSTEVANLRTLAENAGYTGDVIQYLTELEDIYQGLTSGTIPSADIPGKLERAKELTALIQESASNIKYEPEIDYSNATRSAARAGKEAGKSYSDALKDELSNLNDVVGAIGNIINNQIDLYNDQKDAAVDALEAQKEAAEEALEAEKALVQEQIDAKQAEIDKIKEAAEARKNDIDLQQKQYELARLQNQRTILVYSEDKGMHYVQDTKEIRSAKEAVTEAQENIQIAGLEKEISGLESIIDSLDQKIEESNKYYDDLIDQTEKYWDSLIKGLEDYKSRWDELTEIEEQAKVLALLEQMGISTDDVLNMSESAFQGFKESYLGLLGEMYKGNDQMVESLSKITDVDMSSLNGYLATTKKSIDTLQNTDLSNLSDSFDNLAASAGNVSSAINGSGGYSVQSSESGENPAGASSGSSLKSAIKDQTESAIEDLTTQKELFNGDGGLTSAVQEVIDKIGGGSGGEESAEGAQGSEGDSNNLTSALKEQTEEALNEETGIPAQKRAWEELNEPLGQAVDHITTIKSTLEDLDGRTFTVTLNVEGNGGSIASGGITGVFGGVLPIRGNVGVNGTAHIKGSANAKGNWGAKKGGRTLVGELGQELWVHSADGTFETVGNNGAEFINLKPNDIIFNHLQTKQLLDKGNIIGRGKSYAGGTASGNTINTLDGATVTSDGHVLKPIRPGDSVWELQKAFEPLLQKIDGNLEYLAGNAIIEHTRQLEKMISRPNTTSAVTNRNIQPVIHQNIALNCPNVTNNSGIEYIQKELGHLSQMAMQEPIKKY